MRRLLIAVLLAAPAGAEAAAAKAVTRLNRAPVNREVLRVKLPRPARFKLANGLSVIVVEDHKLPTVSLALWVKTGALSDPQDAPGLARAAAEMMREGTSSRDSAELAAEIDDMGASLEASAEFGWDTAKVSASGLSEDAAKLVELMADMVRNPAYSAGELEKYKTRQLAGLEQSRANPAFLAQERFHKALYGDFPASAIAPTPEAVRALTPEKLKHFHARHFVPGNSILGVAGDITPGEVRKLLDKHLGSWKGAVAPARTLGEPPAPGPRRILIVDRPGSVQSHVIAGNLSLRRDDPDYIPLTVANRVLGGGPSARLFLNLREEKGYTYGVYSRFSANLYPGPWSASMAVRNEVTEPALDELMSELGRIRDEAVPADELGESQRAIVASFALSLENPALLLDYWLTVDYFSLPSDYWDRFPEEVLKAGREVVQRMASKYVDLGRLQIVCVGDAKAVKPILKKYGPVEVYDADGRKLD